MTSHQEAEGSLGVPERDQDTSLSRLISRWETDVVLADGRTVTIRPISPTDDRLIEKFHALLSPETIYYRFFSPVPKLSDKLLHRFVNVDYTDRMAFVAILGDSIISVARYDRIPGRADAEVAFLVSDAHQGRGIGSIMLEMLAARASETGISRFIADTLPDNTRMLKLFRDAGYVDTHSYRDGIVQVTFNIEPTPESIERMHVREQKAVAKSIGKILSPRSIAVIGASTSPGSIGNVLFRNILDGGFNGPVYPVNPHAGAVSSVKAYRSLSEIPDEIDLGIVIVPAAEVFEVVNQAAEKNVGGLLIISSGFSETGTEGVQRERELVRFARRNGMRIVGPSCMGIANTAGDVSLNATLAPHSPMPGKASLIAHSGSIGLAIVEEARRRGIGLSTFVSSGNRADVSGNDLLQYWENDPHTRVILLYLESFGNPRSFVRLARRISKSKPIIAVKAKRSNTLPASVPHLQGQSEGPGTPALLGAPTARIDGEFASLTADEAVDAMFNHTGVLRVTSLEELLTLGHAFASQPPPRGPNVAILANSGGPSSIAQDSLERAGLILPMLSAETVDTLVSDLPAGTKTANPVELPPNTDPLAYKTAMQALLADEAVDSVLVVYVPTVILDKNPLQEPSLTRDSRYKTSQAAATNATEVANMITDAASKQAEGSEKTVIANFLSLPSISPNVTRGNTRVPLFPFPELAAQALGKMWEYHKWRIKPSGQFIDHDGIDKPAAARAIASMLSTATESDIAEKSRNLISRETVLDDRQSRQLLGLYGISGASEMAVFDHLGEPITVELELSVIHDMAFGPFLSMKLGGIMTQFLQSSASSVLPLRDTDARELIASIPGSKIFEGYRSIPALDVDSLADIVSRLGQLAENHFEIANISISPLILGAEGYSLKSASIRLVDWAAQASYLMRGLS